MKAAVERRKRGGATFVAGVAALFAAAMSLQGQDRRPYERFAGFATFFEPETAALLGLSPDAGRMSDLGEEGLAARARGYRQLRAELVGPPLFPNAPEELAGALDPRRFADRRVAEFHRVRAWSRSPLYYVRAAADALAAVDLDPGLSESGRRRALTARARQMPYLLDAAATALVNPPRILASQALAEARMLALWIEALAARTAELPEGGEKWALAQALEAADASLRSFADWLASEAPARAHGAPGLGEEVLSEIARSCGFDGAYHLLETLEAAVAARRQSGVRRASEAGRAAGGADRRPADPVSLAAAVEARWPGPGAAPSIAVFFGPPAPGRGTVSAAWRPAAVGDSVGLVRLYVAEDRVAEPLAGAALAETAAQAWLFGATAPGADASARRHGGWAASRRLVAWNGLAGAVRWLAAATLSGTGGRGAGGDGLDAATLEAEVARTAGLVHLGRLDARAATVQLEATGAHAGDVSRLLTGHLHDPAGICGPALGFVLFRLRRDQGSPPPASALAEWLHADPPASDSAPGPS